jgi:hypothetical protein
VRILINVINVMVTSVVSDASHSCPLLFRQVRRRMGAIIRRAAAVMREMKNCLPSWRHSAVTAANAPRKQGDRRTNP